MSLLARVEQQLREIIDPELQCNIVDLGLIYDIIVMSEEQTVKIIMTLTTPFCPQQPYFITAVARAIKQIPEIRRHDLEFTFTPAWSIARASDDIKQELVLRGIPL